MTTQQHQDPTITDNADSITVPGNDDVKVDADIQTEPKKQNASSGSAFYKAKLEELERKNKEMLAKLEEQKTNQLKEKENYKELWEIEKRKREEAENKAVKISKNYLTGLKMSAIEQEALKAGIIPEALSDIRPEDASMVEIETGDKGSVSILGAKEYVEYLKETKKHWFKSFQTPIINNRQSVEPDKPKELSALELIKLQKSDPNKYAEEMKKRLRLA